MIFMLLISSNTLAEAVAPAPNGIAVPQGYKNWRVIGTSHRKDNHSLRVILGNSAAIKAVQTGNTDPWPDGVVLAKMVWEDSIHPLWETATVPGALRHAEFMIKDDIKFAASGGWGFARWLGMKQEPYGKDAGFAQECFSCHTKAKGTDFVFTMPAPIP